MAGSTGAADARLPDPTPQLRCEDQFHRIGRGGSTMTQYYDFFFSFASKDRTKKKNDDLDKFFRALVAKLGDFGRHSGGFYAPDDMHRGVDWEKELASAVTRSRVLVPIYSPNYFGSPYCGKEWQAFRERQIENTDAPPAGVKGPDVILPIIWTADFLKFPDEVPKVQFKQDVDPEEYVGKGLRYMLRSPKRRHGSAIVELIHTIGTELAHMADNQGAARIRPTRPWDEIDPPFPKGYKRGLTYVRYVFLAGRHDQMKALRKQAESYGTFEDRQDWRPCFPDIDRQAGEIAGGAAAEAGKDFEFVEPADLVQKVDDGKKLNNVIAVVADPWSRDLPEFDALVKKLNAAGASFPNSAVLVPWNERDTETKTELPVLKNKMRDRFGGTLGRQEYYNDSITSPETFRNALMAAFSAVQGKLVEGGSIRSAEGSPGSGQPLLRVTP